MATVLHMFRRDLRLDDNTALCAAAASGARVLPCFIFDPRQVQDNPYRSDNAVQFLVASLRDLAAQVRAGGGRLFVFHGTAAEVVARLFAELDIAAVHVNADYTPFSKQRDAAIADACARCGVAFHSSHDALLRASDEMLTARGTPYTVFTPYLRRALHLPLRAPRPCPPARFHTAPIAWADQDFAAAQCAPDNPHMRVRGGRAEALRILKSLASFTDYAAQRDIPSQPTTGLSAHIKFGTVSIREVHAAVTRALGPAHVLINELHWHDFFTHVGHFFPHVFGHAFREKYDRLWWSADETAWRAWCTGRTGFPIVDAGMRELNATGFMHNRVRMMVASFLTKDLHIDWRKGERYFAQKLVDYDPCVNNGNWQWSASTGCDAQPYFRIFNPWLQQKRFDPQGEYIRRWLPELAAAPLRALHAPPKAGQRLAPDYPLPLCDHAQESARAKQLFAETARTQRSFS